MGSIKIGTYFRDLIKGSLIIFVFKLIGAFSLFAINIVISNFYGAKYLGVFNLIIILLQIVSILGRIGLDVYVIKIIPGLNKTHEVEGFIKRTIIIILLISSILGACYLLIGDLLNDFLFKTVDADEYLVFIAFLCVPYTLFSVIPEILRGFDEIKYYSFLRNLLQNLLVLLFLVLPVFGVANYDPVYSYCYATLVAFIVSLVVLARFLKKKGINLLSKDAKYDKKIVKYSFPMLFTSSMLFLMGNLDSFMIGYFMDESSVGYYSACLKISLAITFILFAVSSYIMPKISKSYHQNDIKGLKKIYNNAIKLIITGSLPIIIIICIFPRFFLGLFGLDFVDYVNTLYLVMLLNVLSVLFGPLIFILNIIDKQNFVKNVILFSVIGNMGLNLIFIPRYGVSGAAVATVISTLIWKFILFIKLKHTLKVMEL